MKISKIRIKNCLGIKELEFCPNDVTHITGRSGTGKTSVIDSISQFLTNKGERPRFVHKDADRGEVFIEFSDGLTGKKVFKPDGKPSSVTLEKDGMQPRGAETFLKSLFNPQQINPIEFISKTPKEQTEIILNAVPMELPPEKIVELFDENPANHMAGEHALKICKEIEKKYFESRAESNSQIKHFEGDIELLSGKIPYKYDVKHWESVSLSEIIERINKANEHNKYLANCKTLIENAEHKKALINQQCKSNVAVLEEKIRQLQQQIETAKENAENQKIEVDSKVAQAKEWVVDKEEVDTAPIRAELEKAEKMKSYIALAKDLEKKKKWLQDEQFKNAELENKLAIARALPRELIKSAKFPVENMGIDENGEITVNSLPVKNLSGAQRLDFAVKIAKLTCGELKVILVNGFEALDGEMKERFFQQAEADDDYQYIIAEVTDGEFEIK